jgi:hypothetical protein
MRRGRSSCGRCVYRTIHVITTLWRAIWKLLQILKACLSLALPWAARPLAHLFVITTWDWVDRIQIKVS